MATSPLESPPAAPRPRVDTHPPYTDSFGPEAVELAARAGLVLDPWQAQSLDRMLAFKPDGKYVCFECAELVARQNGKGAILEARALAGLFLLGEELIMWSAHEYKTAMEGYRRVKRLLKKLGTQVKPNDDKLWEVDGRLVKVVDTNGEEGLECLDTEQRLKFIARSKSSGRGFSGDVNIIDEAFAYTNMQHEALLPTMSARQNPQIIYTSSPPLDGISGEVLFGLRLRGDPEAPRTSEDGQWEQDPELAFRDWGLAGDLEDLAAIDLDDRALWRATNPSLGLGRLTMRAVERERRSFRANPASFARERLGVWPRLVASAGGVINLKRWEDLATTAAESGRPEDVAFAVIVAADRSRTTIAAIGPQNDGKLQFSIVAYMPGTTGVVERMVQLDAKWNPVAWAIEDKGATASLWPEIKKRSLEAQEKGQRLFCKSDDPDQPERRDVVVPWATDVVAAYGMFIDALNGPKQDADGSEDLSAGYELAHLNETPLNAAAEGAKVRPLGSGMTWDHRSAVDVGPLRASTNAMWAYVTRVHLVARELVPNLW